jgi:hypothetical protein
MNMKSIGYLFVLILIICGSVYGEENFVMADKLSISDIEAYAKDTAGKYPKFMVLGVHQEGNTANVYYQYQKSNFAPHVDEFKLIRFNSGKWYNPEEEEFVTIK